MSNTRTLKTGVLDPNDYNPNQMTEERFAELVTEIQHLGRLPKPIVARANGKGRFTIVDGEHGWRAAQKAGLKQVNVEVIEADDFEARRQTYKRNQHGEHNPVLLGRMFQQMMESQGLSQRALAKKIAVSEGTIRNALEYAKAAEVRNDYAFDKLTIKQVRWYNRLPNPLADKWANEGAKIEALWNAFAQSDKRLKADLATHGVDAIEGVCPGECSWLDWVRGLYNQIGEAELDKYIHAKTSFCETVSTLYKWDQWEGRWLSAGRWMTHDQWLDRDTLRLYTRHYFEGAWPVRDRSYMDSALDKIIDTSTRPLGFHLTPEEFDEIVTGAVEHGESSQDFRARLDLALLKRGIKKSQSTEGVQEQLMEEQIAAEAPDYIQNSKLVSTHAKFVLWKAQGPDDAKRELAKMEYIRWGDDFKSLETAIQARMDAAAREAEEQKLREEHQSQKGKAGALTLAREITQYMADFSPKELPDAARQALVSKLAAIPKPELLLFHEMIERTAHRERALREHAARINAAWMRMTQHS